MVQSEANRQNGAKGPDDWMPAVNQCQYAKRWEHLLEKYDLIVLPVESAALGSARQ